MVHSGVVYSYTNESILISASILKMCLLLFLNIMLSEKKQVAYSQYKMIT